MCKIHVIKRYNNITAVKPNLPKEDFMIYNLCQRISELRASLGISQSELAKRLDVTRSSVNAWELGYATPQLKHIVEMSKIFNMTLDGMFNAPDRVTVDITDLSEKERQAVFDIIDCIKGKRDRD